MFEVGWASLSPILIRLTFVLTVFVMIMTWRGKLVTVSSLAVVTVLALALNGLDPLYHLFIEHFPEKNPQLSTAIYAMTLLASTVVLLFTKRMRQPQFFIMTFIMCSVLVTTLLFHLGMISGVIYKSRDMVFTENQRLIFLPPDDLIEHCNAAPKLCYIDTTFDEIEAPARIKHGVLEIYEDVKKRAEQQPVLYSYSVLNDIQSDEIAFVTYAAYGKEHRVIIDIESARYAHTTAKQGLYLLCFFAHLFWLVFGLLLILMHNRMHTRMVASAQA